MRVAWTPTAFNDLRKIHSYLEREAGQRVAAAIAERVVVSSQKLERFPEAGRYDETLKCRLLIVPKTPYLLYYRVLLGTVKLLRVRHGEQKSLRRVLR